MSDITLISPKESTRCQDKYRALPHVLLVLDQIPEFLGGGERIALRIAELLPKYGYRASFLTFSATQNSEAVRQSNFPLYLLPVKRTYDIAALGAGLSISLFIYRQQIQLVQTFFESSDLWAGFVTKTMSSAKLIWSRRDMGILRARKHRFAYRIMAGFPDAVFAVSEGVRQHCIDVDRIDPDRAYTIYNAIDFSEWARSYKSFSPHMGTTVVSVGNIRRVKGYDILVKAAVMIVQQFPRLSFNIVGHVLEPDYFAELQDLIRHYNLTDHFHFAGGVDDLKQLLYSADIFVLPSRSEGFSNAIIEAMAASLPVVATSVGGNAESVIGGVSGYLVPSDDPEALASAILALLSNPEKAKAMGLAGHEYALEHFTIDAMMTRIVGTYNKLLTI